VNIVIKLEKENFKINFDISALNVDSEILRFLNTKEGKHKHSY
jgi:hypothetical protein